MGITRVEVSQTKWSKGMQDYITSGVEYVVFPILNDVVSTYPSVSRERTYNFWRIQGGILGSMG